MKSSKIVWYNIGRKSFVNKNGKKNKTTTKVITTLHLAKKKKKKSAFEK
jgi:hypothetical protein